MANSSADDIDTSETNRISLRPKHNLFPPIDDIRKSNLVPFGDVMVPNHPNKTLIPMTIPREAGFQNLGFIFWISDF